jgi:hypothetical protein
MEDTPVCFTRPTAVAAAALLFAACDTGPVAPDTAGPRGELSLSVNSVYVECPSSLAVGSSANCYAWTWDGLNQLVLLGASWSSTAPGVVSVDQGGQITAVSPGIAFIQATHEGSTGSTKVTAGEISVSISGPNEVGTNQECGFEAFISGATSASYSWQVSGATGFSSGSIWQGQSSESSFTLTVTASSGGLTDTATKTVKVTPGFLALCQTLAS